MEEWRDIKGYEGIYQVSNCGRVKKLLKKNEKLQIAATDKDGYKIIRLWNGNKLKTHKVHRLVALAFLENPNNYPQVNHRDEDKTNNNINNLEWCTPKYNVNYGTRNERASKSISKAMKGKYIGSKSPNARKVVCITTGEIFNSMTQAAEKYNIAYQDISKCCRKKRKSAGKHQVTGEKLLWEYYKEGRLI